MRAVPLLTKFKTKNLEHWKYGRYLIVRQRVLVHRSGQYLPELQRVLKVERTDRQFWVTLPDSHGLYYMVETVDMCTNAFAYPAGVVNGYNGGKYA